MQRIHKPLHLLQYGNQKQRLAVMFLLGLLLNFRFPQRLQGRSKAI